MHAKRFCVLITSLLSSVNCMAQPDKPPSPGAMAQAVSEKWLAGEFAELDSYITLYYSAFPNYVPAILAASFRDAVYEGHLADAMQKLG